MTITNPPSDYSFAGNFPDLVIDTVLNLEVELWNNTTDTLYFSEKYYINSADQVTIELREFFESELQSKVPGVGEDTYTQSTAFEQFKLVIDDGVDSSEITFWVIAGGGRNLPSDFIGSYMHSWQPALKYIKTDDIEFITFFPIADASVYADFIYKDETNEQIKIADLNADKLHSVNVSPFLINLNFENIKSFQIYISDRDASEQLQSNVQSYQIFDENFNHDDVFIFRNSLGGIDSIRFTGTLEENDNFSIDSAYFGRQSLEYHSESERTFSKNTGIFRSLHELYWSRDFFSSVEKYRWIELQLIRIKTSGDYTFTCKSLTAFDFQFIESAREIYQDWTEYFSAGKMPIVPVLSVESTAIDQIRLFWDHLNQNITGYIIYHSQVNELNSFVQLTILSESDTEFFHNDLDANSTHYYYIKAIRDQYKSGRSPIKTAKTYGLWQDSDGNTITNSNSEPLILR